MFQKLCVEIKTHPFRSMWFVCNIMGVIAIIVIGAIKISTNQNPLHLIWFIPACFVACAIGIWAGLKINKCSN